MSAWHDEARALAAQGLSMKEIAAHVGRTYSAVYKVLHPEKAREYNREDNAKRGPAKRAWERTEKGRELRRRIEDRHRAVCIDCGTPCFPGSKWEGTERCRSCDEKLRHAAHLALLDDIAFMWNEEGMTAREIAATLGRARAESVSFELWTLRQQGRLNRRRVQVAA